MQVMPYDHGKGAICRLCRTSKDKSQVSTACDRDQKGLGGHMQVMPYEHGSNTIRS